jgi:putative oxygen-independent coproporphyrinogen III oxidase
MNGESSISKQRFCNLNPLNNHTKTAFLSSAYLHIPFCRRRCYYCDFPIAVLGDRANIDQSTSIAQYVEVLCQEIELAPQLGQPLKTIFLGGGTPSLLPVNYLKQILKTIEQRLGITAEAEISMEMDPGTFSLEQLQGYCEAGVNRVSLGVQAFQDELLKACGRSHTVGDIFVAVDLIHQVGISNFSLDLISGLPHQTTEQWQQSVESAIKIAPTHLSCYDLVLEPVTAFGKQYHPGETPLPTDETTAQMYRLAQQILTESGYQHYEISNYAQPGYQCHHNRVYWENRPYHGFGMGAASYVLEQRVTRPRTRVDYYAWVQQLKETNGVINYPETSKNDQLLETLMLGLRLAEGVSLSQVGQQFGESVVQKIGQCLQPYSCQGWVEAIDRSGNRVEIGKGANLGIIDRIKLTDPEGFLFSNTILATLFDQLD